MKRVHFDVIIVGGGAAGFFAAIQCAEHNQELRIAILERGQKVLEKVRVSGGGRCNVTHACFDIRSLIENYPRGKKALLGPFHQFSCTDTVQWFARRGVRLKTEADGRMFPITDNSGTIIYCLSESVRNAGIEVINGEAVSEIEPPGMEGEVFTLHTRSGNTYTAHKVMIATGSSPQVWNELRRLGYKIVEPVPSLFTFNIADSRIADLAGVSVPLAQVRIAGMKLETSGPLLITHWGLSGPAILKMSAFAARELADRKYLFEVIVNWVGQSLPAVEEALIRFKEQNPRKTLASNPFAEIPSRLWQRFLDYIGLDRESTYANCPHRELRKLAAAIAGSVFEVRGKSTFKEEFVTAGGIDLKEINFKRFESKRHPGLFFAGEVLDIDAVTGGFNFQAAWTGGWIAGLSMSETSS